MKKKSVLSQTALNLIFIILCALIIIPFLLLVSISVSNEADISNFGYSLLPRQLDFTAYSYVFKNPTRILKAYEVTGIFSVISMVCSVMLIAMFAYPLSRKHLKGRRALSLFLYFTVLFSGGMVPSYLLITKYLHLNDTIWVYIIPSLIVPWYVFMMRTFFQGIPEEIIESVYIDGGNEYVIFFRIIIPLSKPVFATIMLFIFLNKWNDWSTAILYVDNPDLYSLQYLLQKIMNDIQLLVDNPQNAYMLQSTMEIPGESVRMAMAVIVAGPALLIFPFFQKYFVKGITVGSVKG